MTSASAGESGAVELRTARADDLPAIERIVHLAYSRYIPLIGRRPPPMDHDYSARVREGLVTVAEECQVVGLIVLLGRAGHLFIENVAMAPAAQHRGIGRMLLAYAEEEACRRGYSETGLFTNALMTENRALYARLGYVEVGRLGHAGLARVEMIKTLGRDQR